MLTRTLGVVGLVVFSLVACGGDDDDSGGKGGSTSGGKGGSGGSSGKGASGSSGKGGSGGKGGNAGSNATGGSAGSDAGAAGDAAGGMASSTGGSSGEPGSSGGTGNTGSDLCHEGCVATLAADCPNGPASQEACEATCNTLSEGACATEYKAFQDCAEGEDVTCDGIPVVEACSDEQDAFIACLNS